MYGKDCHIGVDPVPWAHNQPCDMEWNHPKLATFMKYMDKFWKEKIPLWCIGSHNIPQVGQNTNIADKLYHSNLESILNSMKKLFNGHYIDWSINHLNGEVATHYWSNVQCKPLNSFTIATKRAPLFQVSFEPMSYHILTFSYALMMTLHMSGQSIIVLRSRPFTPPCGVGIERLSYCYPRCDL